MTRPGRFLFVTWPGGGNVNPLLALLPRLAQRGHAMRVLGPPRGLGERFAAEGVEYRAHRSGSEWTGGDPIRWPTPPTPAQRMAYLRGLAQDVATEIAREATDVVVVDYMQPSALCAAEHSGIRWAALVHTLYEPVAISAQSPMQMGADVAAINALRDELGLTAVTHLPALLERATRVLVITARELEQPTRPVPTNVAYVGPIVEGAGPDAGWAPRLPSGRGPLVLVSMSTTPLEQAALIQRVLDTLAGEPLRVVLTLPDHMAAADFEAPDNADVVRYTRHAAVLPHASLMITHAGLSSVGAALCFGVPLLCLPLGREQPQNAQAVQAAGAGIAAASESDVATIRARVRELLDDPKYTAGAQRMAVAIADRGRGERSVQALESMLADG